jgi:hypothetical protein
LIAFKQFEFVNLVSEEPHLVVLCGKCRRAAGITIIFANLYRYLSIFCAIMPHVANLRDGIFFFKPSGFLSNTIVHTGVQTETRVSLVHWAAYFRHGADLNIGKGL